MTETEHRRWMGARAYAENQRCDGAAALAYADWCTTGIRTGRIVLPATHETWYPVWYRYADATGR